MFTSVAARCIASARAISICMFFSAIFMMHAAAHAQPTEATNVSERIAALEAGQQKIEETLQRLESKLDQLAASPSEFSRVIVQLRSSDDKPLPGFRATLHSGTAQTRQTRVSGTSGEDGKAIDRFLPYGQYNLMLEGPMGWSARMPKLLIEVGENRELVIAAPDPAERGELELSTGLVTEAFKELPFGEIRNPMSIGYTVGFTPEPDSKSQAADSLPRLEQGIQQVGARVRVSATQDIAQPNHGTLQWHWRFTGAEGAPSGDLLFTPDTVAAVGSMDSKAVTPPEGAEFFAGVSSDRRIAYFTPTHLKPLGRSCRIEVPAGNISVEVIGVLGKASPELQQALGADAESVWLNVNLQKDSQWLGQMFKQNGWKRSEDSHKILAYNVVLQAGEKQTAVLASP